MSTPPRRRLQNSSTVTSRSDTTSSFTIHLDPPTSSAPLTRSMARRVAAVPSSKRNNENINRASLTKSLRSRGPLMESLSLTMNVLEERRDNGNGNGKRKAGEGDEKPTKIAKLEHKTLPLRSTRTSLYPTKNTSVRPQQAALLPHPSSIQVTHSPTVPPTPARDILRIGVHNGDIDADSVTATDSPMGCVSMVARPPTPPRMRERPAPSEFPSTPSTSARSNNFATPRRSQSISERGLEVNRTLSKMPASLKRMNFSNLATPGRPTASTPSQPIATFVGPTASISLPFCPDPQPLPVSTLAPPATPQIIPSPRKVFGSANRRTEPSSSTTPAAAPRVQNQSTPSLRLTAPSPLSSRVAAASSAAKGKQLTLTAMFAKSPTEIAPEFVMSSVSSVEAKKSSKTLSSTGQPMDIDIVEKANTAQTPLPTISFSTTNHETSTDVAMLDPVDVDATARTNETVTTAVLDLPPAPIVQGPSTSAPSSQPEPAARSMTTTSIPLLRKSTSIKGDSSMGPPSRIPRNSQAPPSAANKMNSTSAIIKKPSLGSLPERRPTTRPTLTTSASSTLSTSSFTPSSQATSSTPAIKRKPSYPSSLGSGPLARPTPRMVSNPVLPPRTISAPVSKHINTELEESRGPRQQPQQRSVSAPVPRTSLSASTSRREGLSNETSKSLAGLSEALDKLKMKRQNSTSSTGSSSEPTRRTGGVNFAPTPSAIRTTDDRPSNLSSSTNVAASGKLMAAGHRPRQSINPADVSVTSDGDGAADQSIAALLCSTNGGVCFKGIVAYVDVRTYEGDDSSRVFIDILRGLGARVLAHPSKSCTHIIYKSGKSSTLTWYRRQEDPKPHIVGSKWVTESKKAGKKLEEEPFGVDVNEEDLFQKRRKSMEPKRLAAAQGAETAFNNNMRQALLDIAEAKRKSLLYAPKISSPLKRPSVLRSSPEND